MAERLLPGLKFQVLHVHVYDDWLTSTSIKTLTTENIDIVTLGWRGFED